MKCSVYNSDSIEVMTTEVSNDCNKDTLIDITITEDNETACVYLNKSKAATLVVQLQKLIEEME